MVAENITILNETNTTLLNATNATLLNDTGSYTNIFSDFIQNIDNIVYILDDIVILLLFIIFIYLMLKAIALAKKLLVVALVSAFFPVFRYFINPAYGVSLNSIIEFSLLGCILYLLYVLIKPFLSIKKRFKKKK
ncbi:MAG: hypothetical protein KAQ92_04885 [Candidatus Aenigmarchaeota archaeon]|nr:hypothetical protein [Candidatus Aenigmarchaeota archaeon]